MGKILLSSPTRSRTVTPLCLLNAIANPEGGERASIGRGGGNTASHPIQPILTKPATWVVAPTEQNSTAQSAGSDVINLLVTTQRALSFNAREEYNFRWSLFHKFS
jgi:hypothetical protein